VEILRRVEPRAPAGNSIWRRVELAGRTQVLPIDNRLVSLHSFYANRLTENK